jgi:hypothetical protein
MDRDMITARFQSLTSPAGCGLVIPAGQVYHRPCFQLWNALLSAAIALCLHLLACRSSLKMQPTGSKCIMAAGYPRVSARPMKIATDDKRRANSRERYGGWRFICTTWSNSFVSDSSSHTQGAVCIELMHTIRPVRLATVRKIHRKKH